MPLDFEERDDEPMSPNTTNVTVRFFGGSAELAGAHVLTLAVPPEPRLPEVLAALYAAVPGLKDKLQVRLADGTFTILVNGRNAGFLDDSETTLHNGGTVAFVPPLGGG